MAEERTRKRTDVNPTQYYGRKKQLLSAAARIIDADAGRHSAAEERKDAELRRMENVIVEITTENLELRKGLLEQRIVAS